MIYLDNAATTFPKPVTVVKYVSDALRIYGGNPGRSGHQLSLKTSERIYRVRQKVGRFFGIDAEQIVFTSNCTHALNLAIKGILSDGGHVIISNLEHNSVLRPVHALKLRGVIDYDIATVDRNNPAHTVDAFRSLIRPNTKAIICTHASNVTGQILPIRELGELCQERHLLFVVDAAQSAGVLPIHLADDKIDILCTAGHKGLYGSVGIGLMLMRSPLVFSTLMEGGTGSLSADFEQPTFLPDRYESGTLNTAGILSLDAGISYVEQMGLERIYRHEFSLCEEFYHKLCHIPNCITYAKNYRSDLFVPIVLFNLNGKQSTEVVDALSQKGFCVRGGMHCSPLAHRSLGTSEQGAIRVSPSTFTTRREMTRFLSEVNFIAGYKKTSTKS